MDRGNGGGSSEEVPGVGKPVPELGEVDIPEPGMTDAVVVFPVGKGAEVDRDVMVNLLVGPLKPVELKTGKGGTVAAGAVVSVASILVVGGVTPEIPDTPVNPMIEVVFVNGKGGALDSDSGAVKVDEFPAGEDGEVKAAPDDTPVAPLGVTSGALSVGPDTRVEEELENGNGAEEKLGPEVGTAVPEDIAPDGLTTLKV